MENANGAPSAHERLRSFSGPVSLIVCVAGRPHGATRLPTISPSAIPSSSCHFRLSVPTSVMARPSQCCGLSWRTTPPRLCGGTGWQARKQNLDDVRARASHKVRRPRLAVAPRLAGAHARASDATKARWARAGIHTRWRRVEGCRNQMGRRDESKTFFDY